MVAFIWSERLGLANARPAERAIHSRACVLPAHALRRRRIAAKSVAFGMECKCVSIVLCARAVSGCGPVRELCFARRCFACLLCAPTCVSSTRINRVEQAMVEVASHSLRGAAFVCVDGAERRRRQHRISPASEKARFYIRRWPSWYARWMTKHQRSALACTPRAAAAAAIMGCRSIRAEGGERQNKKKQTRMSLPRRLLHARQHAVLGKGAEHDAREAEEAEHAAPAPGQRAAAAHAHGH